MKNIPTDSVLKARAIYMQVQEKNGALSVH